jgi:hypothetical protein
MSIVSVVIIICGLAAFEIINSIDNAIVTSDIISTLKPPAKKWFLSWGLVLAVVGVRGILPWLIVYASNPSLGFFGALTATFSNNIEVQRAIASSSPVLLLAGGTFLLALFFRWLFIEEKKHLLRIEKYVQNKRIGLFFVSAIFLVSTLILIKFSTKLAVGGVVGLSIFVLSHFIKKIAEREEKILLTPHHAERIKILYLEIIDSLFSMDGVIGAFAFTLSVPLILIGNGIGAVVVRYLTVRNIHVIQQYVYLKNGAMYSLCMLGSIMILDSRGFHVPEYVTSLGTLSIIGYFLVHSHREMRKNHT